MKKLHILFNKYHVIVFMLLIVAFFVVRLYQISDLFVGLHIDEAGILYDAYALSYFNVDRYLNSFPVYMINHGGGQSALYTYLVAILFRLFYPSVVLLRIPAVIGNLMLCISSYFLVRKYLSKNWALFSFVFILFIPFSMMSSRFALDCNLLVGFLALFTVLLDFSLSKHKNGFFIITGFFLGVLLYTYILSWILMPIMLILLFGYLLYIQKINLKQITLMLIPAFILAIPLFMVLIVNIFDLESIQIGIVTIPKMHFWRQGEIALSNIIDNLTFLWTALTFDAYDYNSTALFGTIYYVMIPCFLYGLLVIIKQTIKDIKGKQYSLYSFILIIFTANLLLTLLIAYPNVSKANAWYFSIAIITIIGIYALYYQYKKIAYFFLIAFVLSATMFTTYFFSNYNKEMKYLFNEGIYELVNHYQTAYPNMDIFIESYDEKPYIWYLAESLIDPYAIDARQYIAPNVNFYLPEENVSNAIYILLEDYERITELYTLYENNPNNYALEGYGKYQVYIKW